MRSAILQLPARRTANERRGVLRAPIRQLDRAAIRQLDRAAIYVAAVAYMDLDDRAAQRAVARIRTDLESLKQHLSALRVTPGD